MKKFLVTESCLHSEGQHAEAGSVINITPSQAAALNQAGRGYVVPDDFKPPAGEPEKETKTKPAKKEK